MTRMTRIAFSLGADDKTFLEREAARLRISVAELVRRLIAFYRNGRKP
jgi:hypothetical protein